MMTPYLDEMATRDRIAEMMRVAQEKRLAASIARPWFRPIDIQVRFEIHVTARRAATAANP